MPPAFTDLDRRRRLVVRHHLSRTATSLPDLHRSVAALHSTDPTTPYLAAWARVPGFALERLEQEIYQDRSVVRMHAMRRTLFLVPTVDVPVFEAGAAREVSRKERSRLVGWMSADIPEPSIEPLLQRLTDEVLATLGSAEMSTKELAAAVPGLERLIPVGSGKWSTTIPLSSRLLFLMAMDGLLVRARPAGTWRSSQYKWAAARHWLAQAPSSLTADEGRLGIAARYVATHGPVTLTDLNWWTGWTMTQARQALSGLDVESVVLDDGEEGWVIAGDTGVTDSPGPSVSLLPALDPTIMGWKQRDWYLGSHAAELFDTNGNAGPTVWVDGGVVGGWGQLPDGEVVFELLEEVGSDVVSRLEGEAADLSRWLDGVVVMPRFPSPLGKRLAMGG